MQRRRAPRRASSSFGCCWLQAAASSGNLSLFSRKKKWNKKNVSSPQRKPIEFNEMASFLRRYLIESDLTELASVSSPYVAGALFGAAAWSFGDACAMASAGGAGRPPTTIFLPPLFAFFSLVVLALVPRSYLASLDEGGGVFDTGDGMSSSARAKLLLFLAWGCSFGSAAGGVALAAGSGGGGGDAAARSRLASGSLASTVLPLVAGMVLWFGRGPGDDGYGGGYYGY